MCQTSLFSYGTLIINPLGAWLRISRLRKFNLNCRSKNILPQSFLQKRLPIVIISFPRSTRSKLIGTIDQNLRDNILSRQILTTSLFNTFHLKHWRGDLFGGLTAAVVSLPMALAFGVASGAGPAAGLYGAVLVGLFAALFGGTSTLISEPTGPMTVVMTAVLTTMMAANPDQGLAMAFTVVMIAGVFQIVLGLLKLGKYITLMPYSVISGFMSGIGIILILLQIAPFLGQAPPPGGVTGTLNQLPSLWSNIQTSETFLALFTLAILFFLPKKISRFIPPQLVALVLGTLIALFLFPEGSIRKIGEIPLGLPSIHWPVFTQEQMTTMILDGMVLGTLGCIDALLTAMIADSLTRARTSI